MKNKFLLLFLFLLCGCQAKKDPPISQADFESLMGKGLPAWEYVITSEDFENLRFFKTIYEKNIPLLSESGQTQKIPKILHFIWVGPENFPRESIANVRSWVKRHPGWTIYFWTDLKRAVPYSKMERKFIHELPAGRLTSLVDKTENYAEKADLLRYEILLNYGGIYIDHDVKCFKSFDEITKAFDLFCGLEVPFQTPLDSSVFPTNNLIGAKPQHPVLFSCIDKICKRWNEIGKTYPGKCKFDVINRVAHRTFSPFGESVKECANQGENKDITFPAFFFNAPKEAWAIYAQHLYKGTWFENETKFEKTTRERLMYLSKKVNKILLACSIMTLLNLICFSLIFFLFKKAKLSN